MILIKKLNKKSLNLKCIKFSLTKAIVKVLLERLNLIVIILSLIVIYQNFYDILMILHLKKSFCRQLEVFKNQTKLFS